MIVDKLPVVEADFLGGCQWKVQQSCIEGSQGGIQAITAGSQKAETRPRADVNKGGRIVVSFSWYISPLFRGLENTAEAATG